MAQKLLPLVAILMVSACLPPPPTRAEKLNKLRQEMKARRGEVFETTLQGKPVAFLLLDCKVFLLDPSGDEVKSEEVAGCGFYPWFTGCQAQKIAVEDGYVTAYLQNMAFGAGGGNASGGHYRSRDGRAWEKQTPKGWRPLADAQD